MPYTNFITLIQASIKCYSVTVQCLHGLNFTATVVKLSLAPGVKYNKAPKSKRSGLRHTARQCAIYLSELLFLLYFVAEYTIDGKNLNTNMHMKSSQSKDFRLVLVRL
jgi:hypothetical protein